ncbi:MAG: ABC transporter ATP-binding protein [Spirochaetota bacterium]|nr:ABC transporter ATP-binding protein [Spirochaetota bacterium]
MIKRLPHVEVKKRTFIRIIQYLFPYRKHFLIGSIFAFAFSIANGLTLTSVIPIFDTLSPGEGLYQLELHKNEIEILKEKSLHDIKQKLIFYRARLKITLNNLFKKTSKFTFLIYSCIALLSVIFLRMTFKLLAVYYIGHAANGALRDIRKHLYHSILNLPLSVLHKRKTGELISKIIYDTDLISGTLSNQLRKFIVNIFIVITHIILLLYMDTELTSMAFVVLFVITIPIIIMGRAFKRYSKIEQKRMSDISSIVLETIEGIRIIKSYQMEGLQINRFVKLVKTLFNKKIKKSMIDISRPQIIEIISSIFLVFLLIYGGEKITAGVYTKGELLFFIFTFLYIMNPIKQIANMNNQVKQAESAGERIFELVDHEKENDYNIFNINNIDPTPDDNTIIPRKGIKFEKMYFKYPSANEYILEDISLSIGIGKTVALVGRSGAGKTTLVDLIPRFIEPSHGTIYIDDIDIKTISLASLRRSIGVVSQEIFLFNGTISENIAYGRDNIPMERIVEASKIANAHDFIIGMPDRYNTVVGERGIMVSGGERQRIAIARTLLRNPPILILDEATSSLDAESERLVQSSLYNLMKSRTTFVIAHRLSTIIKSDLIIVIENKRIAESGTHIELLKREGIYTKLYRQQFAEME